MGVSDIHAAMVDAPAPAAATPQAATPAAAPPPKERAYGIAHIKPGERTVPTGEEQTETPAETAPPAEGEAKPGEQPPAQPERPAEPLAKQHAALTRRIRAAEDIERRAEERKRDIEARELKLKQSERELEEMSEDALLEAVAKRKGLSLDQLVKRAIGRIANGGKANLEDEVADLKRQRERDAQAKLDEAKQRDEEAERNSQAAVDTFISGTLELISEDAHPLISDLDTAELSRRVFAVANEYATKTGRAPDRREVLEYLEQQEHARTQARIARLNKQPSESPQPAGAVPDHGKSEPQTRTLTNNAAAESSGAARKPPENWRDRIAYAAEAIPD